MGPTLSRIDSFSADCARESELQTHLAGECAKSGFRRDLAESTGIDVQVRISHIRMIEQVGRVDTDGQIPRFSDADFLDQICIEVPRSRPVDRPEAQSSQLPRLRILQYDFAAGICDRRLGAPHSKNGTDAGACRIRHSLVLLVPEVIAKYARPRQVPLARKRTNDIRRAVRVNRIDA